MTQEWQSISGPQGIDYVANGIVYLDLALHAVLTVNGGGERTRVQVWRYDLVQKQWQPRACMEGEVLANPLVTRIPGLLGAVYAASATTIEGTVPNHSFYKYDPRADRWSPIAGIELGASCALLGVGPEASTPAMIGLFLYGRTGPGSLDFYNPETDAWSSLPTLEGVPSGAAAMAAVGDELFVFLESDGQVYVGVFDMTQHTWTTRACPDWLARVQSRVSVGAFAMGDWVFIPAFGGPSLLYSTQADAWYWQSGFTLVGDPPAVGAWVGSASGGAVYVLSGGGITTRTLLPPQWLLGLGALLTPHAQGWAYALARNGELVESAGYGLERALWDTATPVPLTEWTSMPFASVSKVITAVALLHLLQSINPDPAAIDRCLDGTIQNYVQYWTNDPGEGVDSVTIRQLLQMKSAMAQVGDIWGNYSDQMKVFVEADVVVSKIGTFDYNNGNYCLLQSVIEQMSKMSYVDYVAQWILGPAHASSIVPVVVGDVNGYACDQQQGPGVSFPTITWSTGMGGWNGPLMHLLAFLSALRGSDLLAPQTTELMLTENLGWFNNCTFADGSTAYGKGGAFLDPATLRGFRTTIMRFPDGTDVSVLVNTFGPDPENGFLLESTLVTIYAAIQQAKGLLSGPLPTAAEIQVGMAPVQASPLGESMAAMHLRQPTAAQTRSTLHLPRPAAG